MPQNADAALAGGGAAVSSSGWRGPQSNTAIEGLSTGAPEIVSGAPADTEARSALVLPRRARGRATAAAAELYRIEVEDFCDAILEIRSRLDFEISTRGWAYILETEAGLAKGDFAEAEKLIAVCRKDGSLPVDIVAEDAARQFDNLDRWIDDDDPAAEAAAIIARARAAHLDYCPFSFWRDQKFYLEMLVEKVDLRSLFGPVCAEFSIPIANGRGWSDIHSRVNMMGRFRHWEERGKRCVLLYCGDHDPTGLNISTFLQSNLADLAGAVGWRPDDLVIDRFGLNHEFITANNLTWIDGLETGSGKRLEDPKHPDHNKPYVQDYLERFGPRKVEANALVVRPEAGRDLCRSAILRYLPAEAPDTYRAALAVEQEKVRHFVTARLGRR